MQTFKQLLQGFLIGMHLKFHLSSEKLLILVIYIKLSYCPVSLFSANHLAAVAAEVWGCETGQN